MKHIFILLAICSVPCFAQKTNPLEGVMPVVGGEIMYTGVVDLAGVSKDDLFNRAKRWAAVTYNSANDVIQLSDKEAGSLVAKGSIGSKIPYNTFNSVPGFILHTLTVDVKDGKYRYEITGLSVHIIPPTGNPNGSRTNYTIEEFAERPFLKKASLKYCASLDEKIKGLIANLEKAMRSDKPDF